MPDQLEPAGEARARRENGRTNSGRHPRDHTAQARAPRQPGGSGGGRRRTASAVAPRGHGQAATSRTTDVDATGRRVAEQRPDDPRPGGGWVCVPGCAHSRVLLVGESVLLLPRASCLFGGETPRAKAPKDERTTTTTQTHAQAKRTRGTHQAGRGEENFWEYNFPSSENVQSPVGFWCAKKRHRQPEPRRFSCF